MQRYSGEEASLFMVSFPWQTGSFSNPKITELFGVTYSSVSKRAGIVRKRPHEEKTFKDEFDRFNALIQMTHLIHPASQSYRQQTQCFYKPRGYNLCYVILAAVVEMITI